MRYRYHWSFKLLALILAVISGAVLIVGAAGLILGELDYYETSRQSILYNNVRSYCNEASDAVFDHFAWKDTGIEPKLFERFFRWGADVDAVDRLEYDFYYTIRRDHNNELLDANYTGELELDWVYGQTYNVRRGYVTVMPEAEYYPGYDQFLTATDGMVYADRTGQALPELGLGVKDYEYYVVSDDPNVNWQNVSMDSYNHADAQGADYTIYRIEYTSYESFYVEVGMTAEQMVVLMDEPSEEGEDFLSRILKEYENYYVPMILWGGLVLAMSCLWLALVAGKSPYRTEVRPDGLNRIPLDVYAAAAVIGVAGLVFGTMILADQVIWSIINSTFDSTNTVDFYLCVAVVALCGGVSGLLISMFTMAASAQMKVGDNYWLKHTLVGLCWRWGWEALKWCWRNAKRIFRGIITTCRRFAALLPLTWQWLIASGCVWMLMFFCILRAVNRYSIFALFFGIGVTVFLVLYGAYCFGILRDAAKKMSQGKLEEKVENKFLLGAFGAFAGHLNALGDTCIESAKQQMKSERMKSELITNVSHDIKTPLTSIINYVDLLQKTDDEDQRAEYLEVLDRQSQRLKKLIEDLMEMSRASSGNVAVEITPTDVSEAVNQALGEFSDALESRNLTVLSKAPTAMALCDGKLMWRVLSNVLSNVVKYAMPGTRVYVDVIQRDGKVEVSIKNISAGMLNITAGELMERFVRGDASRNTEGNGLGLNIAKSLMELQGGKLDLVVDGDLFKVVLTLNAA